MSQQVEITDEKFAEALRTVQAYITGSALKVEGLTVNIGGSRFENWKAEDLAKFARVNLTINLDLVQPDLLADNMNTNLVCSGLYTANPDAYYNEIVTNLIQDITHDQDFYTIVEEFLERTIEQAAKQVLNKIHQNGQEGKSDAEIIHGVVQAIKSDNEYRNNFNDQVSQKLVVALQNPEFLAKSKIALSRQLNQIISSQALVTDEDYVQAVNNYLQLQLDDVIRNVQTSIIRDVQNNSLKISGNLGEIERYIQSKIAEQQEALRSKLQFTGSQQIDDVNQIKNSLLDVLNNDEKIQAFINGIVQSKINFAVDEAKKQGHIDASIFIQNQLSSTQLFGQEINNYIAGVIMTNLQNSQLLIKSKMIIDKNA